MGGSKNINGSKLWTFSMGSPLEPLEFQEIYFMINKRIYDKTCQTWPLQSWRRPTVRKLLGIFNPKTPEKQILSSSSVKD